jgi:hypothetical protein
MLDARSACCWAVVWPQIATQHGAVMTSAGIKLYPSGSQPLQRSSYLYKVVAHRRRWRLCGEAQLLCLASLHSTCPGGSHV